MSLSIAIIILALLALIVLTVTAPLRRARAGVAHELPGAPAGGGGDHARGEAAGDAALRREELEAAREAKYREIRDAELDFRTGKLSREDYETVDRELRSEAIEILNRLEARDGEADDANGRP